MAKACNNNEILSYIFDHLQIKSYKQQRQPDAPDLMNQLPTMDDGSKGGYKTSEYKFSVPWDATELPGDVDKAFDFNLIKHAKELYTTENPDHAPVAEILVSTCMLMKNLVKERINTEFATEDAIRLRAHPNYRQVNVHVWETCIVLNLYTTVQRGRSMGRRVHGFI